MVDLIHEVLLEHRDGGSVIHDIGNFDAIVFNRLLLLG